MKRSPIARSTKPIKRTKLKRVSNKQSLALKIYSDLRKQYLAAHPTCGCQYSFIGDEFVPSAIKCRHTATQIHHMARRGINLNNPMYYLAVCSDHHRLIETHANAARKVGLILT